MSVATSGSFNKVKCGNEIVMVPNVGNLEELMRETEHRQQSHNDMTAESRPAIRVKLSELATRELRRSEIQTALAAVDRELEQAVAQHQRECRPLQTEIAKLGSEIVTALTSGGPAEILENQRAAKVAAVATANESLQEISERLGPRRELLQSELDSPALNVAAKSSLESRLQTTASPELQAELFAVQQGCEWAARRVKYAEQKLSDAKLFTNKDYDDSPNNFGPSDRQVMAGRLRRWTAEAKFANEALATARHHEAELIEKMKNE